VEEFQLSDHNPPTSQTDRQTDRRHAIERPRAVKTAYVAYYAVKIVNINEHNNKISTT